MTIPLTRRDALRAGGAGLALAAASFDARAQEAAPSRPADEPFGYCFNTSTIRGQNLSVPEQVDVVAKAGYHAIEPWLPDLNTYIEKGGSLKDLAKRIRDAGLTVESAIGFAEWIADDDERRKKGLEQARRDMDTLAQIGGVRIAAPPAGATNQADLNLDRAAERFHALVELGHSMGVLPQAEVWGFSKCLSKLGETTYVAIESRHPKALILPDIYHLHKGGSGFAGMRLLSGRGVQVFHVNDYPADPPREKINDADRVYPGDGVAPLGDIFRTLRDVGFRGYLSLELFNRTYWQQDALLVAKTGLQKTRAAVRKAFA